MQQSTRVVQYVQSSYAGAYYNPHMAYPMQLQAHPAFTNYSQVSAQVHSSHTVSPPDVEMSPTPDHKAPSAPPGTLKEPK